jgi:hypothetical protein
MVEAPERDLKLKLYHMQTHITGARPRDATDREPVLPRDVRHE